MLVLSLNYVHLRAINRIMAILNFKLLINTIKYQYDNTIDVQQLLKQYYNGTGMIINHSIIKNKIKKWLYVYKKLIFMYQSNKKLNQYNKIKNLLTDNNYKVIKYFLVIRLTLCRHLNN